MSLEKKGQIFDLHRGEFTTHPLLIHAVHVTFNCVDPGREKRKRAHATELQARPTDPHQGVLSRLMRPIPGLTDQRAARNAPTVQSPQRGSIGVQANSGGPSAENEAREPKRLRIAPHEPSSSPSGSPMPTVAVHQPNLIDPQGMYAIRKQLHRQVVGTSPGLMSSHSPDPQDLTHPTSQLPSGRRSTPGSAHDGLPSPTTSTGDFGNDHNAALNSPLLSSPANNFPAPEPPTRSSNVGDAASRLESSEPRLNSLLWRYSALQPLNTNSTSQNDV